MHRTWHLLGLVAPLLCTAGSGALAQDCRDTPEGRICSVQQPITAGVVVGQDVERALGLVTVAGGCSGTLLNTYWVLTARHCVTNEPTNATLAQDIAAPLNPLNTMAVTATWAPGKAVSPSAVRELGVNAAPGAVPTSDIILLFLGRGDLGDAVTQRLLVQEPASTEPANWIGRRLATTDFVAQYGQGLATFATPGVPPNPAVPAGGAGTYRTATFNPSAITGTDYQLAINAGNQVGSGGDSGGPTRLIENGAVGPVAGVQSWCQPTGYVPGQPQIWTWATGISVCGYVSIEPLVAEIGTAMEDTPPCDDAGECAGFFSPVIPYILSSDDGCTSGTFCGSALAPAITTLIDSVR